MNNKIREAALSRFCTPYGHPNPQTEAFLAGASFALKEMEQLRDAAKELLNNLEREDEPGLLDNLRAALSATESYFETDKI